MADDGQRKDGAAERADEAAPTEFPHTEAIQHDENDLPPAPPRAAMVEVESGSWRHNPLVWVLLVVAMFLSVPLLSECSLGARRDRAAKPADHQEDPLVGRADPHHRARHRAPLRADQHRSRPRPCATR